MGATLANNGINPATHEKVMKASNIPFILSAMTMAGLYDGSGGWAWHVGLPAKSGVGGGILAVVPGKGAIAVFAPPLDETGKQRQGTEGDHVRVAKAPLQLIFSGLGRAGSEPSEARRRTSYAQPVTLFIWETP